MKKKTIISDKIAKILTDRQKVERGATVTGRGQSPSNSQQKPSRIPSHSSSSKKK
ncbi:hypothetical protein [Bartonella sp. DGB2]|uniref:hypothetical protein n=1 Tax=Bartonella sp. DGB2 TaxID=3388426 RepID=UPI00398FC54E